MRSAFKGTKLVSSELDLERQFLSFKLSDQSSFSTLKDLNSINYSVPGFSAPSITNLSKNAYPERLAGSESAWNNTLDALLRNEIMKSVHEALTIVNLNIISIRKPLYYFIDSYLNADFIDDGKAKIMIDNTFEFQLTLVPSPEPPASPVWFIIGVTITSFKNVFMHSLSGIFQSRHNLTSCESGHFFGSLARDCRKIGDIGEIEDFMRLF